MTTTTVLKALVALVVLEAAQVMEVELMGADPTTHKALLLPTAIKQREEKRVNAACFHAWLDDITTIHPHNSKANTVVVDMVNRVAISRVILLKDTIRDTNNRDMAVTVLAQDMDMAHHLVNTVHHHSSTTSNSNNKLLRGKVMVLEWAVVRL